MFLYFRKTEVQKIVDLVTGLDLIFFYLETPSLTKADVKIIKVTQTTVRIYDLLIVCDS